MQSVPSCAGLPQGGLGQGLGTSVPLGMFSPTRAEMDSGEDLAQGVGFWYAFLTSFWGPKIMVLSKREGLLPGPGLAL